MNKTVGITDEDRQKLAHIAEHGPDDYDASPRGGDLEPTRAPSLPNHSDAIGDSRGITLGRCNAIRCAAHDGEPYREIAAHFGVGVSRAYRHATGTGDCQHDENDQHDALGVEPVPVERRYGHVDPAECADLRHKYRSGASVTALHERTGRSESTVYRHVVGECSHD